jgi:hypothetical protein
MPGELEKNAARNLRSAGRERKAIQSDHRIAAPIGKPRIARDDGLPRTARHNELIGRENQLFLEIRFSISLFYKRATAFCVP